MLELMSTKGQNFKWVGVLQSETEYSQAEKLAISKLLAAKGCYPIFMTMAELFPYYNFYENVMKTLFHNFKSLFETDLTHLTHAEYEHLWEHYTRINQLFAKRIAELKV